MKLTHQRVKFVHSIDGVNYSLDFFFRDMPVFTEIRLALSFRQKEILKYNLKCKVKHCSNGNLVMIP